MAMRSTRLDDDIEVLHEINVTPFIDVILVLLIIFMVAAPLATVSVPVDLPVASGDAAASDQEPIYLSLQKDLSVSVNEAVISSTALQPELDRITRGDKQARVFLRADAAVGYGDVMALMDGLRQAGYVKVALVTLAPAAAGSPSR